MPSYLERRQLRYPLYGLMAVTLVLIGFLSFYNWIIGAAGFILTGLFVYLIFQVNHKIKEETEEYISTLSYRVKKVGEEAAEVIIAAKNRDPEELKWEAADLLYHLLVLLQEQKLPLKEVLGVLNKRKKPSAGEKF